jgi:hypothetical protein
MKSIGRAADHFARPAQRLPPLIVWLDRPQVCVCLDGRRSAVEG